MNILDRYLVRAVIGGTLLVLLALVALVAFFNFLGEAGRIGTGDYGVDDALVYVLLSTPLQSWELFPIAALIGTLLSLGGLAAHSEVVAMRAAGISLLRIARAAVFAGIALAVMSVLLGDFIAPQAERYAQAERALAMDRRLTLAGEQGIWARDGHKFVNVHQLSGGRQVDGIYIYDFDDDGRLVSSAQAAAARYDGESWRLENYEETRFTTQGTTVVRRPERRWDTQLSPDLLNLFVVDPESLTALGLWNYIGYLDRNGLDTVRYRFRLWSKVVSPLSVIVMIVLALPFVAGSQRTGGAGTRLLIGMLIGAAFYVGNQVLGYSGEVFDLDPALIAWLPTAVLAVAALFALTRIR